LKELDRQVKEFEQEIIAWHRSSELSRKLEKIPGIGPLAASALVASIADAHSFKNGRQVSAWLGLVPRQTPAAASRHAARDEQTRRRVLAHATDPWCALGDLAAQKKSRQHPGVVDQFAQAPAPEYRGGGTGQQERADRVGDTRTRARI
jgi:transposase